MVSNSSQVIRRVLSGGMIGVALAGTLTGCQSLPGTAGRPALGMVEEPAFIARASSTQNNGPDAQDPSGSIRIVLTQSAPYQTQATARDVKAFALTLAASGGAPLARTVKRDQDAIFDSLKPGKASLTVVALDAADKAIGKASKADIEVVAGRVTIAKLSLKLDATIVAAPTGELDVEIVLIDGDVVTQEPAPAPMPKPTPKLTPKPAPQPMPGPTSKPTSKPTPTRTATPPQQPGQVPVPQDALVRVMDGIMTPVAGGKSALNDTERCVGAEVVVVTPQTAVVLGYGATEATAGNVRPQGDTLFQLGSVSKVFTGLGLARLVTEGRMNPADPVANHLAADLRAPLAGPVPTLAQLVSHHSGLPEMPSNLKDRDGDGKTDPGANPLSPGTGYSRGNLLDFLTGWSPVPEAGYKYSNLGSGLLALALQDHLGESRYHATLERLVTRDLGMNDTWGEVAALPADAGRRLAQGYAMKGTARVPGSLGQMGVLSGAGEIVTTGNDIRLFLQALTGARSTRLDPAVALALAPLAAGPAGRDLGYAFEIEHRPDGDVFTKGGNTTSYTAYLMFRRNPAVGVAVLTNCGSFKRMKELATGIYEGVVPLVK